MIYSLMVPSVSPSYPNFNKDNDVQGDSKLGGTPGTQHCSRQRSENCLATIFVYHKRTFSRNEKHLDMLYFLPCIAILA